MDLWYQTDTIMTIKLTKLPITDKPGIYLLIFLPGKFLRSEGI